MRLTAVSNLVKNATLVEEREQFSSPLDRRLLQVDILDEQLRPLLELLARALTLTSLLHLVQQFLRIRFVKAG